ncbi:uncharacterized protein LOC6551570 [Drosophila erecta]|uniref:Uncharacterized protein n=1 Tax=Drosophila erecta TaxID=7220 RepID=B3NT38_DROER|nr:uncharacterized protein LOC6551570 [Drosophila erecta]EDV46218.1 uncharacterized protein Dere_GG18330 [Drosophila erecta]
MTNSLTIAVFLASLCLFANFGQMQAASIVCGSDAKSAEDADSVTTPSPSEVNKFVHSLQCTLEKAKPWIANIEKEAKILEEKARDVTRSLFQRINMLVNVLASPVNSEKDKEKDKDEQKEPEEVTTTTTASTSISTSEASSSSKTDFKEELTTSAPPVHLDWLEDHANEVDYIPEKK